MKPFPSHIKLKKDRITVAALLIAPILLYLPSLTHGFVWDDWFIIFKEIKNIQGLSLYKPTGVYYRPITTLSFLIDQIIWKTNPFGYHLTNIILHTLNSCLLFVLLKSILEIKVKSETAQWLALLPALIFSIYPIHVESVSWIAGRTDLIVTLFVILTFFSYHLYRATQNAMGLIPTFLFFILAIGSKETGVIALPLIFLWEALVAPSLYGNRDKKAIFTTLTMGIVFALYAVSRLPGIESYTGGFKTFPMMLLTKALGYYLRYLLIPYPVLCYIPRIPNGTPYLVISMSTTLLLVAGALLVNKLTWWARGAVFSFLIAIMAILPSLTIIALGIGATPVALRYLYLPSAFFCLGLAFILVPLRHLLVSKPYGAISVGLIIVILAPITLKAQGAWKNDLTFWKEAVKLAPDRAIPHNQLGLALAQEGKIKAARREFMEALKAPDIQAYPWEKGKIYINIGKTFLYEEKPLLALREFEKALNINPSNNRPRCYVAEALFTLYKRRNNPLLLKEAYQSIKSCLSSSISPKRLLLAARIALLLSRREEAYNFIKELIIKFPSSPEARDLMSKIKSRSSVTH